MFPIYTVPPDAAEFPEQMGTKFKFWYNDPLRSLTLFKEGRPGTGENWAEKLAAEFALMLGIPHASYDLAQWRDRFGVLSPSFVSKSARLIHGNELVLGKITVAPNQEKLRYYAERSHTATRVFAYLKKNTDFLHPPQLYVPIEGVKSALDIFIGYILFDAWISNQDRHSENWGVVRTPGALYLAPSYDHGSSLGRQQTDEQRSIMLTTRDKGASLEAYVRRARSAIYPNSPGNMKVKSYLTSDLFELAWRTQPIAGNVWRSRLGSISMSNIIDTINQVPDIHMSHVAKNFTACLLKLNIDRLLALKIE